MLSEMIRGEWWWIDYKTTTYNFDADKSLDSENHEALMLLDYIGVTKRFTNIPIGTFLMMQQMILV